MSSFFISYQSESTEFAHELRNKIQEAGLTAWLFEKDLRLGDEWKAVIDNALIECKVAIVVVTLKALASKYVTYEWAFALGKGKRVIPLVLEKIDDKEFHPKLYDRQQVRNFINQSSRSWEKLIAELKELNFQEEIPVEVLVAKQAIYSHDDVQRQKAINFLQDHQHRSATEALAEAVQNHSPQISMETAFALAEKTNYKDERVLLGLAMALTLANPKPAIIALKKMNTSEAVSYLVKSYQLHFEDVNRRQLIRPSIAQMTDPSVIPVLCSMVLSGEIVELQVIEALGDFGDPQAIPALRQYFKKLHEMNNQPLAEIRVINALEKINHPDAVKTLCESLVFIFDRSAISPNDINLQGTLIETLRKLEPKVVMQELENLLKNDQGLGRSKATVDSLLREIRNRINNQQN